MNRLLILLFVLISCFSCSQKNEVSSRTSADLHLEIVDSMRIDHLGELWIQDYDSISKEYIGLTGVDQELVIFDQNGQVTSSFVIPIEGPNSIHGIFSLSFRNGEIQILDSRNGFHFLNRNGIIESNLPLPYAYIFVNNRIHPAFYEVNSKIAYLRPERSDSLKGGSMGGLVKYMYELPIVELYDSLSGSISQTMKSPKTSIYADGNYYFIPFPTVSKQGDLWFLYFMNELKYFVYKEQGADIVLEKTVDLEVNDAILPVGVPFSAAENFSLSDQRPGRIQHLYRYNNKTVVIYSKGISPETILLHQTDQTVELENESYAAVFGENNDLLKNDIPVPEGLVFSRVINENGEILAMKDQDHFGVEEDFVIYYKLKLLN
ncbi:hypothetical protein SAMN04489724_4531 [Algoriphagus locisalis]|uniref:TolB-like 6-blade propeller-like n=1 Tax=Algoriphagus locisalis TaxID=305507 RepID=A0A1I7DXA5_9BACT|nr:hypothetical protein [Algoriphagus locisalis]SFU16265.1 hypothetical protein SAMN04489724_4531 [Algoriphagus locisalis]